MTSHLAPEVATLGLCLGLLLALACYLVTNLSPGGMITPAWLALTLYEDARRIPMIAGITLATWGLVVLVRRVVILYGKRLFASVVAIAVFLQMTLYLVLMSRTPTMFADETLGFVVPGLIAYQLIRQPVAATAIAMVAVTGLSYVVLASAFLLGMVP